MNEYGLNLCSCDCTSRHHPSLLTPHHSHLTSHYSRITHHQSHNEITHHHTLHHSHITDHCSHIIHRYSHYDITPHDSPLTAHTLITYCTPHNSPLTTHTHHSLLTESERLVSEISTAQFTHLAVISDLSQLVVTTHEP